MKASVLNIVKAAALSALLWLVKSHSSGISNGSILAPHSLLPIFCPGCPQQKGVDTWPLSSRACLTFQGFEHLNLLCAFHSSGNQENPGDTIVT